MKLILTLLLPCLFLGTVTFTSPVPDRDEAKQITALRLSETKAKAYRSIEIAAFTVDAKGILRPQKNYDMHLLVRQGKITLKPTRWGKEYIAYSSGDYKEVPLPDGAGIAACMCMEKEDDCDFEKTDELGPDRDDYNCTGSCGCSLYIVLSTDGKDILDYETPGGRWFGF